VSTPATPLWLAQKERGSALLMATITRIALFVGRPAAAMLLYPICGYFMLFSGPARRASADYLTRVLGRRPRWRDVFRHYHAFATTILDRVFLYTGRTRDLRCEITGLEALRRVVGAGRGCLLFGAHFGSFEVLRAIAVSDCPVPIRVLMHDRHAEKLARVLRRLNAVLPAQVIPLGRPQTMLDVRDALARGEIVALLADRSMHGDRQVSCAFLGERAGFPRGPFELAALLDAPVMLFSATWQGRMRYDARFEQIAAAGERNGDRNGDREAAINANCERFAAWLDLRCRASPYNWFNVYDFWAQDRQPRE